MRSFVAFLEREAAITMDTFENGGSFTDSQLIASVFDLFTAGSDTTSTTLYWGVLLLARHPEVQERLYQEILHNFDQGEILNYADRIKLPYAEAVIMEIQRYANLIPLGDPRRTIRPTTLLGYDIPEDAIVFPFLANVLNDPLVFLEPQKFNPSRFLDMDGKVISQPKLIPFQAGRRSCLGQLLARMELFLFLVSLIRQFRLYFPSDQPKPSLEPRVGVFRIPKHDEIFAEVRNN